MTQLDSIETDLWPEEVTLMDVGPRDGLQNEEVPVSVDDKVELIAQLQKAGCSYIEAGSFVSKKAVPSMANSVEVIGELDVRGILHNGTIACLVPNMKGFDLAKNAGIREIAIFGSSSEAFSQKVRNEGGLVIF